jgi:hypothetical protein
MSQLTKQTRAAQGMVTRRKSVVIAVAMIALIGLAQPVAAHHSANTFSLWYDDDGEGGPHRAEFYNYDFRGNVGFPPVDWPMHYLFYGNAHVNKVKQGMCSQTVQPYCDTGGPQHMWVNGNAGGQSFVGFDSDLGRKRKSICGDGTWWPHMRLYAPHTNYIGDHSFYSISVGYFVVGTSHLDYHDDGDCPGRAHGFNDVAENWFNTPLANVPGWTTFYECCSFLGNANSFHVTYHGTAYPHYYENNDISSVVHVP